MKKIILLSGLFVMGLLPPVAMLAQETEAPDNQAQTAEAREQGAQTETNTETEKETEDTEETEEPSLIEDIIPSEMISEDLMVDFPIDI